MCNIGLDADALDSDSIPDLALVQRFKQLSDDGTFTVVVAGGVRDEVSHPRTPTDVKDAVMPKVFNLQPGLNSQQTAERGKVEAVLRGNAKPGAHAADASHLSEAAETGCAYFVTHDKRTLSKRDELRAVLPPSLTIVTLEEFFAIYDRYEADHQR